ncbi:hypothetical protein BC939DRAFT_462312 [Gamsiella multidivaricata]|uniref:uncharacterized protein n=1 Tax=Gamsiella multidivaricata TaxID=101098 RepID=UPI00221FAF1F|nr:uncharacterized protein BC939DRAFT_462312 [Gamsiella multidivaricata]KAI7818628.1 hypothetical protein BC939DRAFT_462312 [Gamsiella multidivaricata]
MLGVLFVVKRPYYVVGLLGQRVIQTGLAPARCLGRPNFWQRPPRRSTSYSIKKQIWDWDWSENEGRRRKGQSMLGYITIVCGHLEIIVIRCDSRGPHGNDQE